MFGDLDWPLNASHSLSGIAEFLLYSCEHLVCQTWSARSQHIFCQHERYSSKSGACICFFFFKLSYTVVHLLCVEIGNYTQFIEWYRFEWHWLALDWDFKVTISFSIEYLKNNTIIAVSAYSLLSFLALVLFVTFCAYDSLSCICWRSIFMG